MFGSGVWVGFAKSFVSGKTFGSSFPKARSVPTPRLWRGLAKRPDFPLRGVPRAARRGNLTLFMRFSCKGLRTLKRTGLVDTLASVPQILCAGNVTKGLRGNRLAAPGQ